MEATIAKGGVTPSRLSRSYRLRRGMRRYLPAYLFLLPSLIVFLAFTAYPMLDTVVFSLQNYVSGERFWTGLGNYTRIFDDELTWTALKNTVAYFLAMVPFGVVLATTLAGLITLLPSQRMQSFYKGAYYLPAVTCSSVIISLIWLYLYDPSYGFLNYLLGLVGVAPQKWLSSMETALPSLALMMHSLWWGGNIILLCASMGSIPADLYESAKLDGANIFNQFTRITIPLIRPAMTYVIIMASIASLRIFAEILLMTRGGPANATINIALLIYRRVQTFNFGVASAYAMVLLVITITMSIVMYRRLNVQVEY